jgi:cobalt/nickel transport system permease protein
LLRGAGCVVLQTTASGIAELPFRTFLLVMLPIHLAIGIGEGLATAAVVSFVYRARPAVFAVNQADDARVDIKPVLAGLVVASVLVGGALSWFASSHPDGLEWSISNVSSSGELSGGEAGMHRALSELQEKTSFLPDYGFKGAAENETGGEPAASVVNLGTSTAGLVGGTLTLAVVFLTGLAARCYPIRRAN